jgi:outer membrane lipoprotein-sorting protein
MKYLLIAIFLLSLCFPAPRLFGQGAEAADPSAMELMEQMTIAIDQIKTATYTFRKSERFGKNFVNGAMVVKLQVSPFKTYVKITEPEADKGVEVLYMDGFYGGKALINTNGFPYINVKLYPKSNQMMRNRQHHPVSDVGFGKFRDNLLFYRKTMGTKTIDLVRYEGSISYKGYDCDVVRLSSPDFRYVPYTVREDEDLFDIENRMMVSAYLILENNEEINSYSNVKAGQLIRIPSSYSKETVVYLNRETHLPVRFAMYDDKGIFESYEFLNVRINPRLLPEEFSEDFDGYGF